MTRRSNHHSPSPPKRHSNPLQIALQLLPLAIVTIPHISSALTTTSPSQPQKPLTSKTKTTTVSPPLRNLASHNSPLHKIQIIPSFLNSDETSETLLLSQTYATSTNAWSSKSTRHTAYNTIDFPVEECDALQDYFIGIGFEERVLSTMSECYNLPQKYLSFLDLFCVHYNEKHCDLEMHRDGSLLSFTILLSSPDSFEGGGTAFDCLKGSCSSSGGDDSSSSVLLRPVGDDGVVCPSDAGTAVLHSGKMLHGGHRISRGERTVLVGFVDVDERIVREGRLSRACRDWGRMDVAKFRAKRQRDMVTGDSGGGWMSQNERWLPKIGGRSWIKGFVPRFQSVEDRAKESFQRDWKLRVEEEYLEYALKDEEDWGVEDDGEEMELLEDDFIIVN